ncbi:MAG: hypothetical protein Fur0023_01520 [Bacteroidia bacterium]
MINPNWHLKSKMVKHLIIVTLNLFIYAFSQYSEIDSLMKVLMQTKDDVKKYKGYFIIGNAYQEINTDSAIYYHKKALQILNTLSNSDDDILIDQVETINQLGWDYYLTGDYVQSLNTYSTALNLLEQMKQKHQPALTQKIETCEARTYGNLGVTYMDYSAYSKALEYFFKSLTLFEKLNDKKGQANALGNIGIVFDLQRKYDKAIEYYNKVIQIAKSLNDKDLQASVYGNIGLSYKNKDNYEKALEYFLIAKNLAQEIQSKIIEAINLENIGEIYKLTKNYDKALQYYSDALKINKELGNKIGVAINYGDIGRVYYFQKKYDLAEQYLLKSEILLTQLNSKYHLNNVHLWLSELYAETKKMDKAYIHLLHHKNIRDSIFNEDNQRIITTKELQYQYEKEKSIQQAEFNKKIALEKAQRENQKKISKIITIASVILFLSLIIITQRLYITNKQRKIILRQHKSIEIQKNLLQEKNKEITDSINYAKRIQEAILPSQNLWTKVFPQSFILYLPKDIVAGDFYWLEETKDYVFVAVADCTGHGVPGAMVSVVCSNALTKCVIEEKLINTNEILNKTREIVIQKLHGDEQHIRDGMDICLIRLDKQDYRKIQYSGANRPLVIIQNNELIELKPDKQPIGWMEEEKEFSYINITLQKDATLYLFTDGYADQFGGDKNKKIGSKRLMEELKKCASLDISEQQHYLLDFLKNWKKQTLQIDDITIIGIKI